MFRISVMLVKLLVSGFWRTLRFRLRRTGRSIIEALQLRLRAPPHLFESNSGWILPPLSVARMVSRRFHVKVVNV